MAQTLAGQAISIGQRNYAVFKVLPTYGGRGDAPNFTGKSPDQSTPALNHIVIWWRLWNRTAQR
jgi:hypothetical protein